MLLGAEHPQHFQESLRAPLPHTDTNIDINLYEAIRQHTVEGGLSYSVALLYQPAKTKRPK